VAKYSKNMPTKHQTVFRFEIEQMIDKKLYNIDMKKKMSFRYNKPLVQINEESEERSNV
jgi:hypothetical protein